MNARILIVEDEIGLATTLKDRLQTEDYFISVARNGNLALDMAINGAFDLLILDLILPGQSGLDVCEKLRQLRSRVPILILSERRRTIDKVIGLRSGADDYVTKPFKMVELLARIDALLRRARRAKIAAPVRYKCDDREIGSEPPEVRFGRRPVRLSPMEFRLFRYFQEHRGTTLSRDEIWREVWGNGNPLLTRTVDVHVAWLRQKLERDPHNPSRILTVVCFGYKFVG